LYNIVFNQIFHSSVCRLDILKLNFNYTRAIMKRRILYSSCNEWRCTRKNIYTIQYFSTSIVIFFIGLDTITCVFVESFPFFVSFDTNNSIQQINFMIKLRISLFFILRWVTHKRKLDFLLNVFKFLELVWSIFQYGRWTL
jgi:hypothetical protein